MGYRYKFTIVMPVYNVMEFIEYAVDSVIAQDVGISCVQLILVDDGSTDRSGTICDDYAAKYPNNIFVIHKPNGGLSSARNAGLARAEGKYVNFMDPDDHIPENALSEVWNFFEAHYDETDITALKIIYFDGKRGNHYLNYKFSKKNRVENLRVNWDCPHMHVASAFFKLESVKNLRFDTRISFAEDGLFSQTVIMEKQTIGLVSSSQYDYRIRTIGQSSLIQGAASNPKWYIPTIKYYHLAIVNMGIGRFGYLPKYLQMVIMYELQWRFKRPTLSGGILDKKKEKEYFALLCEVLEYIDDQIIVAQRYIHRDIKLFILALKHEGPPEIVSAGMDILFKYSPSARFYLSKTNVYFDFIKFEDDLLIVDGYTILPNIENTRFELFALVNGKTVKSAAFSKKQKEDCLGFEIQKNYAFKLALPISNISGKIEIKIAAAIDGDIVALERLVFRQFVPLCESLKCSSFFVKDLKVSFEPGTIVIEKCRNTERIKSEIKFLKELYMSKKLRPAAFYRVWYRVNRFFKRKPVWVISDRATMAGDNGEALFDYVIKNHPEIDARYVLDENCADYKRLKGNKKLLKRNSRKHKLYLLLSDFIISSHAENEIFSPFGSRTAAYKDIIAVKKRIFLQHGITKNDVSDWLNIYSKNFSGFVCAAIPEYRSIIEGEYFYSADKVWLTGFPRFDKLENKTEKRIVIMPTWRKYLCSKWDKDTDVWQLLPNFEESDYYIFYNSLINDERLISAADRLGYMIDFFPHPNIRPHIDRFAKNEKVNFVDKTIGYTAIYNRSALLLTDYSSAAFDFAYLRKPIVYTHFDEERFFKGDHVCEQGYFDDERDGFGEVEYDLESTVDRLIEYMEKGCLLKEKYRKRIENFFAFNDRKNSERVCRKILDFKGGK